MSSLVMVSRNHVLNNETPQKIVDFVNDSDYYTGFCVISRQKRMKMPRKNRKSFFQKKINK